MRLGQLEARTREGRRQSEEREQVDMFLTTEIGGVSAETKKISVFPEEETKEPEEFSHVFSVSWKRAVETVDDPGEGTSAKVTYWPIIPGLSPIEWTVLVYPRVLNPEGPIQIPIGDPKMMRELPATVEWARHPCCGTLCAGRDSCMRETTKKV